MFLFFLFKDNKNKKILIFLYINKITYILLVTNKNYCIKVTTIGDSAFYGCTNLTSISFPNSVTSIDSSAFYNCKGTLTVNCNLPDFLAYYAPFKKSAFSEVKFGSNVTSIGNYAFYSSSIKKVTISSYITSIGQYAFSDCSSLTSTTFSDTTTWYVGNYKGATTTQVDVSNATSNATLLKSTHYTKYWTKR